MAENLLDATPIIHDALIGRGFGYATVGGLVTDALLMPTTRIDNDARMIVVDSDSVIPTLRPNGTVKDIDLLAFTANHSAVKEGLDAVSDVVAQNYPRTSVSLSGYDTGHHEGHFQFVTRTVYQNDATVALSMGAIRQEIPRWHLEDSWSLWYGDAYMNILHPAAHLASYKVRSITGVRPKDADKVRALQARLQDELPPEELNMYDVWGQFAETVQEHYSLRRSLERPTLRRTTMTLGRIALGMVERSPRLVAAAQGNSAPLARITHATLARSKTGAYTMLRD